MLCGNSVTSLYTGVTTSIHSIFSRWVATLNLFIFLEGWNVKKKLTLGKKKNSPGVFLAIDQVVGQIKAVQVQGRMGGYIFVATNPTQNNFLEQPLQ